MISPSIARSCPAWPWSWRWASTRHSRSTNWWNGPVWSADVVRRVLRTAGLPSPAPTDRVLSTGLIGLCRLAPVAIDIFGEDAIFQLLRVMGSAMARIADAMVSSFLANVEPMVRDDDPVGLEVAKANSLAIGLFPEVITGLDGLLRQHLLLQRRTAPAGSEGGFETRSLGVGFVDLVESTALARSVDMVALGVLLTEFENLASDAVVAAGGRVVKLIGTRSCSPRPTPPPPAPSPSSSPNCSGRIPVCPMSGPEWRPAR